MGSESPLPASQGDVKWVGKAGKEEKQDNRAKVNGKKKKRAIKQRGVVLGRATVRQKGRDDIKSLQLHII